MQKLDQLLRASTRRFLREVGIDRNPAMLATARARADASGHTNVFFVEADLDGLELDTDFDAVVGRLILLHLRDPVAVVRKLTRRLRPGGIVAFQEPDLARLGASYPPIPLVQQLGEWVRQAHHRLGLDTQFGLRLHQVFLDAGLPAPRLHLLVPGPTGASMQRSSTRCATPCQW